MDIFSVISLFGGLAFFLYGMTVMSSGLEKMAGSKLEGILKSMTSNRFKGLVLGAAITAIIQSSSAVTVMLVGLVNSGIMKLSQSIGVIMGTNIGTTITAWILSLTGLEGDNIFIRLLKPESFAPIFALIGILLISISKKDRKKNIGSVLIGFALLMTGMTIMSTAMKPLADMPGFKDALVMFQNPIFGILAGIVITALLQSSSASVGLLQSIATTGMLPYGAAIPIIMGQNIGTCITSLIASIGANKNAKRVTAVHISFNVIGTVILITVFYSLNALFNFAFVDSPIPIVGIAIIHSLFNILTTIILFPFAKQLEKLAKVIIPDRTGKKTEYELLDERLLATPSFAIVECKNVAQEMAELTYDSIVSAIGLITHYDVLIADKVREAEEEVDVYEDKLGNFLVKLSSHDVTQRDINDASELLHSIGDFERISDHALNLVVVAEEIHQKSLKFSDEARAELEILTAATLKILDLTFTAFKNNDTTIAEQVEPLEQVIDKLKLELKSRHIKRLQSGKCTIELGFVLSDLLTNFERISDHCSNIAIYVIQVSANTYADEGTHEYLSELKSSDDPAFEKAYQAFKEDYRLPKDFSSSKSSSSSENAPQPT